MKALIEVKNREGVNIDQSSNSTKRKTRAQAIKDNRVGVTWRREGTSTREWRQRRHFENRKRRMCGLTEPKERKEDKFRTN